MEKIWMLFLLLALVVCSLSKPSSFAISKSSWTKLSEFKVHPSIAAGFINESRGITVGTIGICFYSLNGGKNWTQGQNESKCLYALEIINENIAWACGNFRHVRLTKDGGKTWIPVTDSGTIGNYISFLNDRIGWIASEDCLVITSDGGMNWVKPNIPTRAIGAISLLSANEGFLLDKSEPVLYITKDSGKSWAVQKLGFTEVPAFMAMRWFDLNRATIIGYLLSEKKEFIFETIDGGLTWQKEIINDKLNNPFLTRDGKTITLLGVTDGTVKVYHRTEINN